MSEMVEDVAAKAYHRWLSMQAVQGHWSAASERTRAIWLAVARTAIEAMREPTEAMLHAPPLPEAMSAAYGTVDGYLDGWDAIDVWQAMIAAALTN